MPQMSRGSASELMRILSVPWDPGSPSPQPTLAAQRTFRTSSVSRDCLGAKSTSPLAVRSTYLVAPASHSRSALSGIAGWTRGEGLGGSRSEAAMG